MKTGNDCYPGFRPVRIPYQEWLRPPPLREGEKLLWSDGSARTYPETDADDVVVLRRIAGARRPAQTRQTVLQVIRHDIEVEIIDDHAAKTASERRPGGPASR